MPSLAREVFTLDRSQLNLRAALRCVPGVALPLFLGIRFNHPGIGIFAASGAMSVGFGAAQRLYTSRIAPMLLAAAGMALSTLAGSFAGRYWISILAAVALWGFVCGLATSLGRAASYIGLQCIIALLITSNYNVPLAPAANRAVMVLIGGLVQTLLIWLLLHLDRETEAIADSTRAPRKPMAVALHILLLNLFWRSPAFQYALRLCIALVYAMILARLLPLANSYWVPMTVAIVLKPDFRNTLNRGVARIIGTIVGALLATALSATLHPTPPMLAVLTVLFAGLSYLLLSVNYAAFAICITSYIVFLLALTGLPESLVMHYRTLNTSLGGAVAFLMHARIRRARDNEDAIT